MYFAYLFISLLSIAFCQYETSLPNGIVGQFSHLFSHQCLSYKNTYSTNIYGSCSDLNNTLFEIRYVNSSTNNFYVLSYTANSSNPKILYGYSYYWYFSDTNFNWCLGQNSNTSSSGYCYYTPGSNYQFNADFTNDTANTSSATFTLKNVYYQSCFGLDLDYWDYISYVVGECQSSNYTQLFAFKKADINLVSVLHQINLTGVLDTSKNKVKFTWFNPNNIANVAYMIIPQNQSITEQGNLQLQNALCSSKNSLSPIDFQIEGNDVSITVSIDDLEACNIVSNTNYYYSFYQMKLIHVFIDQSIGFSQSYEVYFPLNQNVEQIFLVGEFSSTSNQSQIFEFSSVEYIQLSNLVSMNFIQSVNQTYLPRGKQNFTINLSSLSNYNLTIYNNYISLISVNANTSRANYTTLFFIIYQSTPNEFNITIDLSNVTSNYYKFRMTVRLERMGNSTSRMLQSDNDKTSDIKLQEYTLPETYYIGSNEEIQNILNSNDNDKKSSTHESKEDDKTTIIALSVVLGSFALVVIIGILIWKREKLFAKNEKNETKIATEKPGPSSNEHLKSNEAQEKIEIAFG